MKVLWLLVILTVSSVASERALMLKKMKEEQRIALVIGNNSYKYLNPLKNPVNDARAMKEILASRGFELIYRENVTKREMKKLIEQFTSRLEKGGVGLYYFAGHGINADGNNYLAAVDAELLSKEDVEYEAYALNRIIKKMQKAKNRLNIVILDACRNDPFARGDAGGLAPIGDAKGIFVAYATQAGNVAQDGTQGHGVFTKNLIKNIQIPGAPIETVFKKTRDDVQKQTHGTQSPGVYNQITGDFFFTFAEDMQSYTLPKQDVTAALPTLQASDELEFWNYVSSKDTKAYYKAYMKKYPDGTFVEVAQEKIKQIVAEQKEKEQAALKSAIQERDKAHIGVGLGFIGAEIWIRKGHFDYGTGFKTTLDTEMYELAPFVNYHPSLEKDGIYGSFSFGYQRVEVDAAGGGTEKEVIPGIGLGVGFRSVFYDFIYIDYGAKLAFNKEQTEVIFNAFSGFEF